MKHFLFTAVAALFSITSFAQDKTAAKDKKEGITLYYINYVKVNKSAVDKLPASRIASMKIVEGKFGKPGTGAAAGDEVVYIETKEYAAKRTNKIVTVAE